MHIGFKAGCLLLLLGLAGEVQSENTLHGVVVPVKKTERYIVSNWRAQDGLPFDQIRDIAQQKNGFIWVATLNGAARFDGVRFDTFNTRKTPELANNAISSLYEDSRGMLWFGHDTGHLTVLTDKGFQAIPCHEQWPKEPVAGFIEDRNTTVWAVNRNGDMLPVHNLKSGTMHPGKNPETLTIRNGKILTSANGHIFLFEDGTLPQENLLIDHPEITGPIKAFAGTESNIWVAAEKSLQRWKDARWIEDLSPVPWQDLAGLTLLESRDGTLFIGTSNEGIFVFDRQGGIERINRDSGMDHNHVLCLYEDREGTVWAGTKAGITAIRPRRIDMIRTADAWNRRFLRTVAPRAAGGVWVGTDGNGLYSANGQEVLHMENGIAMTSVQTVLEDYQETLWVNSPKGFLFRINSDRIQELTEPAQKSGYISALYQENNGMLWAGGSHGLWRWNGIDWLLVTPDLSVVADIRCITSDRDGAIWFGMASGGLGRFYNGVLSRYGNADGLPSEYIRALYFDPTDNALWIGTCGGGLARWQNNRFTTLSTDQGLPGNVISFILDDQRDRLWMITNQGLAVIDKGELRRCISGKISQINPLLLDSSDGLSSLNMSDGLPAGCQTSDGQLYFATDGGLITIDPDKVKRCNDPVPVIITGVQMNNREVSLPSQQPLVLAPEERQISIDYTALSFISSHRIRFMYRIVGLDSDWIAADARRTAIYRDLRPGSYQFEIKACNSDGIWNDVPATLAFTVTPFFRETWWFKGLLGLAAIFLATIMAIGIADRINRRKLIRIEQLRAVDQERARIALDIHDEVGAGLTRISLLSHLISDFLKKCAPAGFPHIRELDLVVSDLIRSLDEIVWVITPRNDSLDSLAAYLEKYVSLYLRDTGILCYLDIPIDLPDWPVSGPVRHNLFLIVKEAVNNIVKHSGASRVTFTVSVAAHKFSILIQDNGKGISDQKDHRFSQGQSGMARRMEQINGELNISSPPDGGTVVQLDIYKTSMRI